MQIAVPELAAKVWGITGATQTDLMLFKSMGWYLAMAAAAALSLFQVHLSLSLSLSLALSTPLFLSRFTSLRPESLSYSAFERNVVVLSLVLMEA